MDSAALRMWTDLLDLDGFEVVEAASDRAGKVRRLTVVPTGVGAALCPACGTATADRHACRDRAVVDLPACGWRTELVVRLSQFECGHCGRYFTPGHPALAEGAHATERFLDRLADHATRGDVSAAAQFLGVPEKTAERWYYDHLERARRTPASGLMPVASLGIDELSVKKARAAKPAGAGRGRLLGWRHPHGGARWPGRPRDRSRPRSGRSSR